LLLYFELYEGEAESEKIVKTLVNMIEKNGMRLTTGFIGTPFLLHALSDNGRSDIAYDLLLQEGYPSWLYAIDKGATTMREHRDGIMPDGSFRSSDMNSFNHYAYGSVVDWIYENVLGIKLYDEFNLKDERIKITPLPNEKLGFAKGSVLSYWGKIDVSWAYENDGSITYDVTLPQGIHAELDLLGLGKKMVGGGTYHYRVYNIKEDGR
jgi:alpha-L-rhamnosidase